MSRLDTLCRLEAVTRVGGIVDSRVPGGVGCSGSIDLTDGQMSVETSIDSPFVSSFLNTCALTRRQPEAVFRMLTHFHRRVIGALPLACFAYGCGSGEVDVAWVPPPLIVEASHVRARPFSERLEIVGQLRAAESVVIQPELGGVIESIEFEEGQRVARGDLLFRLRPAEQRAALRSAKAARMRAQDEQQRTLALSKVDVAAASDLMRANADVESAEAQVDLARVNLRRTEIRAPFDGTVGARYVSEGARVDTDSELAVLETTDRLKLEFSLPESAQVLARTELPVRLKVAAYPDENFSGEVYFISPSLDPTTRRLSLLAWVANADKRLRSGMFARVSLEIRFIEAAVVAIESAVFFAPDGAFVWKIYEDGRAERMRVELGPRDGAEVVVESGLSAGDLIVVSGTHRLSSGAALDVRIVDGDAVAGSS